MASAVLLTWLRNADPSSRHWWKWIPDGVAPQELASIFAGIATIAVRAWLSSLGADSTEGHAIIPVMRVREVVRLIEADGWRHVRTRGSHRQYNHASKRGVVTVPGRPNDELAPGTLNSILKQAGLK
jgi:predicted RNA binding protein YcfA (HicA-like mRNA interferase family)